MLGVGLVIHVLLALSLIQLLRNVLSLQIPVKISPLCRLAGQAQLVMVTLRLFLFPVALRNLRLQLRAVMTDALLPLLIKSAQLKLTALITVAGLLILAVKHALLALPV